jgi:GH25 family lysozyme M1 (1,4-beta-N-acetylmuramidase)
VTNAAGIDISAFQGQFDWPAYREKIAFAGIRVSTWTGWDSFAPDPQLHRNATETWQVFDGKLPRWYYHETRPGLHNPRQQAKLALEVIGGHLCKGDVLYAAMEETDG